MIMMMMMMMTMMTNTIPYRRTKTHIWDKVLMGIWVHPVMMMTRMMAMMFTVMKVMTMMMMTLGNAPFSATAVQTNTTSSPQDFANIQIF